MEELIKIWPVLREFAKMQSSTGFGFVSSVLVLFCASFVLGNDNLCDNQLAYFERSLNQREDWAIFGKNEYSEDIGILELKFHMQFSTLGRRYLQVF